MQRPGEPHKKPCTCTPVLAILGFGFGRAFSASFCCEKGFVQQVQVHGTALYSIVCDCTLYNTHRTARRLGSSPSDQIKCNQQVCLLAPSAIPPLVLNLRLSLAPAPAPVYHHAIAGSETQSAIGSTSERRSRTTPPTFPSSFCLLFAIKMLLIHYLDFCRVPTYIWLVHDIHAYPLSCSSSLLEKPYHNQDLESK